MEKYGCTIFIGIVLYQITAWLRKIEKVNISSMFVFIKQPDCRMIFIIFYYKFNL